MMVDITERLRLNEDDWLFGNTARTARKEITTLREKLREALRPDFSGMREMLRAMQAGELTVSRGIEILSMWSAGNWSDDMLPPVRQDLIEEDSMPVEIIDRLREKLRVAEEALKEISENAVDPYGDGWCGVVADEALSKIREVK